MYLYLSDIHRPRVSIPANENVVNYSLFKNLNCSIPFQKFAIKYVGNGNEVYHVNGKRYAVQTGDYLLANRFAEGSIEIESNTAVSGICIDILPEIISDVVASFRAQDVLKPDHDLDVFFNSEQFPENRYKSSQTEVGRMMQALDAELRDNPTRRYHFNNEFYYTLAEKVVTDHIPVYKQLQNLSGHKLSTRKELLRKIYLGKSIIEEFYKTDIEMSVVASECCMSEYHYFRVFKKVMGISPYQYLLNLRLTNARNKLRDGGANISQIADELGFSDLASFSKAFKKQFGVAPSQYISGN